VSDSNFMGSSTSDVAVDYGKSFVWDRVPCLPITPDQIHINTDIVAINPSGTQMVRNFQTPFTVLETDFAGTALAAGSHIKDGSTTATGKLVFQLWTL
jgi:NADPH:quinone reductase-like Zn-dependent oxidoreductase